MYEQHKFYTWKQKPGESCNLFLAQLREATLHHMQLIEPSQTTSWSVCKIYQICQCQRTSAGSSTDRYQKTILLKSQFYCQNLWKHEKPEGGNGSTWKPTAVQASSWPWPSVWWKTQPPAPVINQRIVTVMVSGQ